MGSNFLIKMTRLQNIVLFIIMFCSLVISIKILIPSCIYSLNLSTPGINKEQPSTKKVLLKKMRNQMGSQDPLLLIGIKVLVMMISLLNIVISGAQGLVFGSSYVCVHRFYQLCRYTKCIFLTYLLIYAPYFAWQHYKMYAYLVISWWTIWLHTYMHGLCVNHKIMHVIHTCSPHVYVAYVKIVAGVYHTWFYRGLYQKNTPLCVNSEL